MNEIVKKNGINFGIYTALFAILSTALAYAIDLNLFSSFSYLFLLFALYIVIGIILLRKTKKDLKGVMSFKEGFTAYFISIVIGILASVIFSIVLFNYIDPEAQEVIKENTLKNTVEMMEKWDTPKAEINKAIEQIEKSKPFSIAELSTSTVFYIAFYSVIGLILAAIFKSKPTYKE
jgi:Protein of unknown function (DUF4199)